jgi:hypothetical protein
MNNQFKILSFSLKLKTFFKKEDNVTFDEKSMILGYDKGTEEGVIWGKYTYYVAKWTIWKQRNKIKYQNILCQTARLLEYLELN